MATPGISLRLRAVLMSAGGAGSDAQRERAAQARAAEDAQVGAGSREVLRCPGGRAAENWRRKGGWVSWGDGGAPPDEKQRARSASPGSLWSTYLAVLNRCVTPPLLVCGSAGSWSLLRSRCTATTWSRPVRASRLMATTGNEPENGGQLRQPDGLNHFEMSTPLKFVPCPEHRLEASLFSDDFVPLLRPTDCKMASLPTYCGDFVLMPLQRVCEHEETEALTQTSPPHLHLLTHNQACTGMHLLQRRNCLRNWHACNSLQLIGSMLLLFRKVSNWCKPCGRMQYTGRRGSWQRVCPCWPCLCRQAQQVRA